MQDQPDTVSSRTDPTRRFTERVSYYVRSRPKYPPAFLEFCTRELALRPEHRIADVGSGTGILSAIFLANGNTVFAVEPNTPMRQAAEKAFIGQSRFHSRDATAEATGLPDASVDFVVAGQAFHWFDPPRTRVEFKRILIPGGYVVLIWNQRRAEADAFSLEYEKIIRQFGAGQKVDHHTTVTHPESKILADFFAPGGFSVASFENAQDLDLNGVHDRALSSSYLPLPGESGCDEMLGQLDRAFAERQSGGVVRIAYDTKVYYGQLLQSFLTQGDLV